MPPELRRSLAAHWRIYDPLDARQIACAVEALGEHIGPSRRMRQADLLVRPVEMLP